MTSTTSTFRLTRGAIALLLLASFTAMVGSQASAVSHGTSRLVSIIVQSFGGSGEARDAVESVGGTVTHELPIIDGVSAEVRESTLPSLSAKKSVQQVTRDARIRFNGAWEDPNITHRVQKIVRSHKLWDEGVTGAGVTVALLDTGVYADHPDLAGRVVACEDLSHERDTEAHCADTFGHGTFMAGLIAGDGTSSSGKYVGTAPDANIVSVKAAGFDGSTDISTILAGIQWVVSHRDVYDISALNLSLGSDSSQDYRLSPLNYAVERAWSEGITVVVSAGNSGPDGSTVMKPGDDPFVVTVGASNDQGTMSIGDDTVPVFSSRGPTRANGFAKPDVVVPGIHTISLRSPGSAIDQQFGETAAIDGHYFRGSGTSMSTASTTGVVAQVLQANPGLNPNQVKARLLDTSRAISETDPNAAGRGLVDAYGAARSTSLVEANQNIEPSTGLGLLQADRGTIDVEVVTPAGQVAISGEFSAQLDPEGVTTDNPTGLLPYSSATYTTSGWDPTTWDGSTWKNADWVGSTWKGSTWKATVWDGSTWKGSTWKNEDWMGSTWKDFDWDGSTWKGSTWKTAWYAVAWD